MIWSNDLAYAVGLIASDGNLSNDGRHIHFVSKDLEQIQNFSQIFQLKNKISQKKSGYTGESNYFYVQFSKVSLYKFLLSVGLTTNKSKTLGSLHIPDQYFPDYLRGYFDGDGFTYSYWDKRWKKSFMFYLGFTSASLKHINWIMETILRLYKIKGSVKSSGRSAYQLCFSKRSAIILVGKLYYSDKITSLSRKRFKIVQTLDIISTLALAGGDKMPR